MKAQLTLVLILIILFSAKRLISQQNHLDVEGHAKIRGNIDINHMDDTTSVLIGRNSGVNTDFSSKRSNTFVGSYSGFNNTTGRVNAFFGREAGIANTEGSANNFFGASTGRKNTTGAFNDFYGHLSGRDNTSGSSNSFFGGNAGIYNITGNDNSFFGVVAGRENTIGNRNTFIGSRADLLTPGDSLDRAIAIGYNAKVACSHCAVIGGTGEDAVNVGIGTTEPLQKLHIVGNRLRIASPSNAGKFIDFRTDGSALDVASTGGKLFLAGNGGEGVIIQQFGGNVAIGNDTSPDAKLDVVGDIHYTGSISDMSDIRLKENMVPLENSIDKISRLNGFVYNLIGEKERSAGVSAQDVQKVLPEAVSEIDDGYLGVDYTQLVPLLIEGLKEQQSQINQLTEQVSEIEALKQEMAELRTLLKAQIINASQD